MNLIYIVFAILILIKLPFEIISFRRDKNDKLFRTKIINHWITTIGLILAMFILTFL